MAVSTQADQIIAEFSGDDFKMGEIKKRAKAIKRDHALAEELWSSGGFAPRLIAILVFDPKQLTQKTIEDFASDLLEHEEGQQTQLADSLLANQLMKSKKLSALLETWAHHSSPILRRLFWYHQARLRWTGQVPPGNSAELLGALEANLSTEKEPIVQWAMNFCAGQIGVHESKHRARCIKLGEQVGLYKDDKVARNCTPSYLPEFIRIEAAKREGA